MPGILLKEAIDSLTESGNRKERLIEKLIKELDILTGALEVYADDENWEDRSEGFSSLEIISQITGVKRVEQVWTGNKKGSAIAQEALKKIDLDSIS